MNAILLNRIGIVLNFLAGFMLAPELLGIERLRRIENYMDMQGSVMKHRMDVIIVGTQRLFRLLGKVTLIAGAVNTIFMLVGMYASLSSNTSNELIRVIFYCIFSFVSFCLFITYHFYNNIKGIWYQLLQKIFISRIMMFLILPSITFSFVVSTPFLLVISILNSILSFTLRKLEGEERLRSILIWWGIIFFIVGNALQFISTF